MPNLTQQDAEDAILAGRAEAEEFMREFVQNWRARGARSAMKRAWSAIPSDFKDKIKARDPENYRKVVDYLSKP